MIGLSSGLEGCVGVVIRVQLVCNRNMSAMTKGWPWSASCAIVNNKNSTYYQNCTYIEVMEPKGWFFFNAEQTLILKVE